MLTDEARQHIDGRLHQVAAEESVQILFAAESGSRAWGFASPDSDYDVRFIYAHPEDWYLTLASGRDVIERPLDEQLVDLSGWDVKKALQLLLKSNPVLNEWFASPIIYLDDRRFRPAAQSLFERHASAKTLAHHYAATAGSHWTRNISGKGEVRLKRYFYVIRPLLSLQWVIERQSAPPMSIGELMAGCGMPEAVRDAIDELIAAKTETPELGDGARIPLIDAWIAERIATLDPVRHALQGHDQTATRAQADRLFRETIRRL